MECIKVNMDVELCKAARGRKTKLPVELLIHGALCDYPAIQRRVARLFGITED